MKTSDSLYIRILLWAYSKQDGFTESELLTEFDLHGGGEKYRWFIRVFKEGTNDNVPMIVHFYNKTIGEQDTGFWCLSEKGMSAAIDYLELKEARESSRHAIWIAVGSLIIATLVGIAQIYVQINF